MTEERNSKTLPIALIGLIGAFLTTCGGIGSALVTSAVTVYQMERQQQQVALPASQSNQKLKVDTSSIFITRQEAADLDPASYYTNLERAFVLHRPLLGWEKMEEMTVREQLAEENIPCQTVCDQPVYRIRNGEPIEVESDRTTTINGHLIPDEILKLSETLYGPPPWKTPYYNQVIVNVFEKSEVEAFGMRTLPDMILFNMRFTAGRVNRIVARVNSHFAIIQLSSTYENIRADGQPATMTVDNWVLFSETDRAFYTVDIRYSPQSGQSIQVWDDLQTYIDQFRVIQ